MMTKLLTPANGETVTLHTERQKYFREHHREMAVHSSIDWLHLVHTGEKDNSHPAPVTFAWEGDADTMELSLHADMTDFDNVQEGMHALGCDCKSLEGAKGGRWVLLDYGDIVVNIFSKEARLWYDLERIWRDGELVETCDTL